MVVLSGFPPSSLRRVVSYQSYVRNHVVIHGFVVIRMIWGAGSLAGGGGGGGGIGSGGELKGEFLHKLRHLSHGGYLRDVWGACGDYDYVDSYLCRRVIVVWW